MLTTETVHFLEVIGSRARWRPPRNAQRSEISYVRPTTAPIKSSSLESVRSVRSGRSKTAWINLKCSSWSDRPFAGLDFVLNAERHHLSLLASLAGLGWLGSLKHSLARAVGPQELAQDLLIRCILLPICGRRRYGGMSDPDEPQYRGVLIPDTEAFLQDSKDPARPNTTGHRRLPLKPLVSCLFTLTAIFRPVDARSNPQHCRQCPIHQLSN